MQAYNNDPVFKQHLLDTLQAHRDADRFVQGAYESFFTDEGEDRWQGCGIACTFHSLAQLKRTTAVPAMWGHLEIAEELDIPRGFTLLLDALFEALPMKEAMEWPQRMLAAIPVGADLFGGYETFMEARGMNVSAESNLDARASSLKSRIDDVASARNMAAELVTFLEKYAI